MSTITADAPIRLTEQERAAIIEQVENRIYSVGEAIHALGAPLMWGPGGGVDELDRLVAEAQVAARLWRGALAGQLDSADGVRSWFDRSLCELRGLIDDDRHALEPDPVGEAIDGGPEHEAERLRAAAESLDRDLADLSALERLLEKVGAIKAGAPEPQTLEEDRG